ncbi:MAG: hypothetical protein GWP04_11560 [Gammaproteobacteria bacterium]|nr:hypothetical protein [Gammaproteobacteria bacterium]
MKLAIASNNGVTIQRHFGRTRQYVVVTIEDGRGITREIRTTDSEQRRPDIAHDTPGHNHHHQRHKALLSPISDCDVLIAGGMGIPMVQTAEASGMDLILTTERLVDDIVSAYIGGTLEHHPDLAHEPGH